MGPAAEEFLCWNRMQPDEALDAKLLDLRLLGLL